MPCLTKKIKNDCLYLKIDDDDLFKKRSKRTAFVLRPLLTLLNLEVDKLSLQKLEFEMDRTDDPVNYSFLEIGYCGHPNFPYTNTQL